VNGRFPKTRILLEPGALPRVACAAKPCGSGLIRSFPIIQPKGSDMVITSAHLTPLVALIAGILILIMPRLLNFIVAIYLIFIGIVGLNNVHHFFNWN
jgi:DUF3096 family protein